MNVASIANSRFGPRLGMLLAGYLPRPIGRRVAVALADRLARRTATPLVRAIRTNQAVIRGLRTDDPALQGYVAQALHVAASGYVDLYWALARGRHVLEETCYLEPPFEEALHRGRDSGRGLIIVGAHMSSFDLMLLSMLSRGYRGLALAHPEVQGSYPVINQMRRDYGADVMPASVPALRAAIRHLRAGGLLLTGVDRGLAEGDLLTFFDRPARMPTGHARLAVRTGAYVLTGTCQSVSEGRYRVIGGNLIDPRLFGEGEPAALALAQHVLSEVENYIRQRPEEWLMFHPVWPEAM